MPVVETDSTGTSEHLVAFADDDRTLIRSIVDFLGEGLDADATAMVIATRSHLISIDEALDRVGYPSEALHRDRRLVAIDVAELLDDALGDGREARVPDRVLRAVQGMSSRRPVRVFGELVGALWEAGRVRDALDMEASWSRLVADRTISKFCTYRLASVAGSGELLPARRLCDEHTGVVALASIPTGAEEPTDDGLGVVCRQVFVPAPATLRYVRRFVASVLSDWRNDDLVADATIVVGELATNALVHAASPFELALVRRPGSVRLVVRDTSAARPELREPSTDRLGGRGMILVDALCSTWGVDPDPEGKAVWAEFVTGAVPRLATT